jgi:hypothetical protein
MISEARAAIRSIQIKGRSLDFRLLDRLTLVEKLKKTDSFEALLSFHSTSSNKIAKSANHSGFL